MKQTAALVIFEQTPFWKNPLLAKLKESEEVNSFPNEIYSVTSLQEAFELFHSFPASFLIVELTFEKWKEFLALTVRLKHDFPHGKIIAFSPELMRCTPGDFIEAGLLFQQSGSLSVCTSLMELTKIVPVIGKHFQTFSTPST